VLLKTLQQELAVLYEAHVGYDIYDFLITDAKLAARLEDGPKTKLGDERLLVEQSGNGLGISLYIDAGILTALARDDPTATLHHGNLNAFLIALEGVSHFQYLSWNAGYDKPVTLLEMELQAEVDKYVTAAALFSRQITGSIPDLLHRRLFTDVVFDPMLDADASARYRDANHYAAKYCSSLKGRFPGHHQEPSFINELRRFYRLPQNEKIRLIDTAFS
jgi:hypothetical protein